MGFAIKVNDGGVEDTEAWEADYEADEIVGISVQSAGGEVARLQVDNASPGIRLEVVRRSAADSTYLDMEELRIRQERGEKREKDNADRVAEGRAMTDEDERPLTAPSEGGGSDLAPQEESEEAVPEEAETANRDFDSMTKDELQSYADDNGLTDVDKTSQTKQEMLDTINAG